MYLEDGLMREPIGQVGASAQISLGFLGGKEDRMEDVNGVDEVELSRVFMTVMALLMHGCGDDFSEEGVQSEIVVEDLPSGEYFIFVDGYNGASGSYRLNASTYPRELLCDNDMDDDGDGYTDCEDFDCAPPPVCPPGNHCDNPLTLTEEGLFNVDLFDGLTDNYSGNCGASNPEVVFVFEKTLNDSPIEFEMDPGGIETTAYLPRADCDDVASELFYVTRTSDPLYYIDSSPAGTYYLFVERAGLSGVI